MRSERQKRSEEQEEILKSEGSMKTAVLIAIIVLADSTGDVFLTMGMKQVGEISTLHPRALLVIGRKVITNRSFLSGIFFMAVTFFSFLIVLSWADLSLVFPGQIPGLCRQHPGSEIHSRETVLSSDGGNPPGLPGCGLISLP